MIEVNKAYYRIKTLVSILVIASAMNSCITRDLKNVEDLKKCKIDFKSIRVKNMNSEGIFSLSPKISLDTELIIENPNESAVTLYAFDFDVFMLHGEGPDQKEDLLGKMISEEEVLVPAVSKKIIPVKINSEFNESISTKLIRIGMKLLRDLSEKKETEFLIQGNVKYKTFLGNINLPVREIAKAKLRE